MDRFEGHNLGEALSRAAEYFGAMPDELVYHVVLEKRGFLGGIKRVVIEAAVGSIAVRGSALGPAVVAIAWAPDVLGIEEYAELVTLLGDVIRANNGSGVHRVHSETVGLSISSDVLV